MHRRRIYERDDDTCQYCGNGASSLDHLVPKRLGGRDRWENLVAACGTCNRSKGDDAYAELAESIAWLIRRGRTAKRNHPPLFWQVQTRGMRHEPLETNSRRGGWFDRTLRKLLFTRPGRTLPLTRRRQDVAVRTLVENVPMFDRAEARRVIDRLVSDGKIGTTPRFYVDGFSVELTDS